MEKVIYDPNEQKKIGMLTPSSNTVLEPICSNMLAGLEKTVTVHYGRFRVTKISLEDDALSQFDDEPMLEASRLLADADVDVIAWNGTSGGWLGFDTDVRLCDRIKQETGICATTSMLSQMKLFRKDHVKRIHLITPYTKDIQEKLIREYAKYGIEVVNNTCLEQYVNRSFSLIPHERIEEMFAQVCTEPADGISVVCTNFPAMWDVKAMEEKYGITVYDTINTVVWDCLDMAGLDPALVQNWGRLFEK